MSVIVFNTKENAMYADEIVTVGSVSAYATHKVSRVEYENGWKMLIGKIGTPAMYAPAEQFIARLVETYVESGASLSDLDGTKVVFTPRDLVTEYNALLNECRNQLNGEGEFTFLIALSDGDQTVLAVMSDTLSVHWGIKPVGGGRDVVLGSSLVTAAYNATPDAIYNQPNMPTVEKLSYLDSIQYIGGRVNSFHKYTFTGDVDERPDWR